MYFYPFSVSVSKCGGSCNTIDNPYARVCFPNQVRNMNIKDFNLMSEVKKTKFLVRHESCECKCGLNENICNSKEKWSRKEWCEYKEFT